jgi:hypothetical protein
LIKSHTNWLTNYMENWNGNGYKRSWNTY